MNFAGICLTALLLISTAPHLAAQELSSPERRAATEAAAPAPQDDNRTQYPAFLANSYFSIGVGYIDYAFSERQLQPGFHAASIGIPHVAARVALFGHEFNRHLAAQLTYMRPVRYVTYTNIDGDASAHHVWTHFGAVTLKARMPIAEHTSLYAEGGLAITSRHGFLGAAGTPIVRDAQYASALVGGGVERRVSSTWDLTAGVTYSPGSASNAEPHTIMGSGGFRYTMRPLPEAQVEANARAGFHFPANLVQVEFSTGYGYAINTFLSKRVPVFWGGNVKVDRGIALHYDRNVFHTRKVFALDFGASASTWRTRTGHQAFATLSAYPLFRFTLLRTRPADFYLSYSLAGPTYISRVELDGLDTGHRFTFQDFIGTGLFFGRRRSVTIGVKINHYSNGNIFTENAGVKIPLTLGLGYVF